MCLDRSLNHVLGSRILPSCTPNEDWVQKHIRSRISSIVSCTAVSTLLPSNRISRHEQRKNHAIRWQITVSEMDNLPLSDCSRRRVGIRLAFDSYLRFLPAHNGGESRWSMADGSFGHSHFSMYAASLLELVLGTQVIGHMPSTIRDVSALPSVSKHWSPRRDWS
jgi:hypothetical protein